MPSLKRTLDIALAGAALAAAAPVLAAAALAIKLESRGPVLFAQARVGRGRRLIQTLKLRTMVTGADKIGPQVTSGGDPRITRVGRVLRKTKVDELPQLWNVLRGDMSLVGPRPEVPRYVEAYRPEWERLLSVRPGITDRASLAFRDEESLLAAATDRERGYREVIMPLKLDLALEGVERASVSYDLGILVRTALSVLGLSARADAAVLAEARRRIEALNQTTGDV